LGVGRELFQLLCMNERRTRRTYQGVRREFGPARRAERRRHEAACGTPTRYGPATLMTGAPVIFQACLMPMKMMNALIRPDGNDPITTRTGSAAISPEKTPSLRKARPLPGRG